MPIELDRKFLQSSVIWRMLVIFSLNWIAAAVAAEVPDFSREILPILSDNCFYCHGPDSGHRKADLRLDEEAEAKKVRDGTAAIVPGKSSESEIIRRMRTDDPDDIMPPPKAHKVVTKAQIDLIAKWIDAGAPWKGHWAFEPLRRPPVPVVTNAILAIRNPVDAFILNRLQQDKLQPSPEADKRTLIRRVTLDLTGLPPLPGEVDAFTADKGSDAYERLVERLLNSPSYGERMAWDWMELARYADSNGYQGDSERTMWPWRDWVIKAFNDNMRYDEFTIWQLAGDLLPNPSIEQKLATGFNRNHPINGEGGRIPEENRVEYVMDMAETTGTAWLALTMQCARCHDHKFDPISARDYYSLTAFFNQTPVNGGGGDPQTAPVLDMIQPHEKRRMEESNKAYEVKARELDAYEVTQFPRPEGKGAGESEKVQEDGENRKKILNKKAGERREGELEELQKYYEKPLPEYSAKVKELIAELKKRDSARRAVTRVMVMQDRPELRKTFILEKGLYNKPGKEVPVNTPEKFPPLASDMPTNRLGLARWIVSNENPLAARVTVNRFWQMFFGVGIVKTAEDFGRQAETPKHPELLDWLASDFRDNGWDVKRLVRMIVTSSVYRQSSRVSKGLYEMDPENRLLARGPRYRLPSWMIRDQALAASGLLVRAIGGVPVKSYQPAGVWEEATFGGKKYTADKGEALYRRSLYLFWRRIVGPTVLFDTPSRSVCSVKPMRTNTPLHALTTLNDITFVEAARHLAGMALRAEATNEKRLHFAFRRVLGRAPTAEESKVLLSGIDATLGHYKEHLDDARSLLTVGESPRDEKLDPAEHAAWTATALAMLNFDETLTKE